MPNHISNIGNSTCNFPSNSHLPGVWKAYNYKIIYHKVNNKHVNHLNKINETANSEILNIISAMQHFDSTAPTAITSSLPTPTTTRTWRRLYTSTILDLYRHFLHHRLLQSERISARKYMWQRNMTEKVVQRQHPQRRGIKANRERSLMTVKWYQSRTTFKSQTYIHLPTRMRQRRAEWRKWVTFILYL